MIAMLYLRSIPTTIKTSRDLAKEQIGRSVDEKLLRGDMKSREILVKLT